MLRRNLPMLIAIGGSLVIHGLFIGGTTRVPVTPALLNEPREERVAIVVLGPAQSRQEDVAPKPQHPPPVDSPEKDQAPKPEPDSPPAPKPDQPNETEQPPKPKPPQVDRFPDLIGDMKGKGIGTHDAEGDQPLKAREADADQPFLSRDPRGPGRVGNDPSPSLIPPGEGGTGGAPARSVAPAIAAAGSPAVVSAAPAAAPRVPAPIARNTDSLTTPPAPPVKPSKSEPAENAPPPSLLRLPTPPAAQQNDPGIHLGPLLLLPKPAAKQAFAGNEKRPGTGDAGAANALTLSKDDAGVLPPRVERPSATPGRTDGVASPTPIAVPRIAPPRTADEPDPAATRPKVALLLLPSLPPPPPVALPPGPATSAAAPAAQPAPTPPATPPVQAPAAPPGPPSPTAATAAPLTNPPVATGDGRRPGPTAPAADPAQASDSESDAFARIGTANLLRDGKLDVQFGRKVKTVRPKVPLVGQIDAFAMRNPSVTLKVNIDPTGKVTHVMVHKSSGSNEIDQPCLIAMYEWWFEPLKDKSGKPIPDTLLFTISFR